MAKFLNIQMDNIDISGKTITESEEKLAEVLPNLTYNLVSNTILLGQGLPNKLSSLTPSAKKQRLEELTKSDFMIEDIKTRLASRTAELNNWFREIEDKVLVDRTNLNTYVNSLTVNKTKAETTVKPDFDTEIENLTKHMTAIEKDIKTTQNLVKTNESAVETTNANLLAKTNEKAALTKQLYENYTAATSGLKTKKIELETQKRAADNKVKQFKEHPDRCPTCNQPLPDAEHIKAEKAKAEKELESLTEQLNKVIKSLTEAERKNTGYEAEIKASFEADLAKLTAENNKAKIELNKSKNDLNDFSHAYDLDKEKLTKLTAQKESWDKDQAELTKTIKTLQETVDKLTANLAELDKEKANITEHITRVKWLTTLTTRDFRGFLLTDIVKYIDAKAKTYAEIVFGHKDLNIYLDGNNLDISYNGKMFDNLSGGEKTRVDLILQLAIRNLLQTYFRQDSNIIVLDEVTDFLDKTSCQALFKLLTDTLKEAESVFIISHHSDELDIPIDSELHVYKDNDGISQILI